MRFLQFGWRLAIDGEQPNFEAHRSWAMNQPVEVLQAEFRRRIVATAKAFDPPLDL